MLKDRWPNLDPYYLAVAGDYLPSGSGIGAEWKRTWSEQPGQGMIRQMHLEQEDPSLQSPAVAEERRRLAEQDAAYRESLAQQEEQRTGVYQPRTLPPIVAPSEVRTPEDALPPRTRLMEPGDATAKYGVPGVLTFKEPVREGVAKIKHDEMMRQLRLNDILARSSPDVLSGLGRGGAWALAQAVDPFNLASAFIPVVGEARYAAWLKNYGKYGARILKGAAEGGVGQAMLEPFTYLQHKEMGDDYGPLTAFLDVAFGTALGGGLHVGMGALGDAFGKLKFRDREALVRGAVAQLAENGEVRMDAVTPPVMRAAAAEARKTVEITRAEEAAIQRYRETGDIGERRDVRIERARDILEGGAELTTKTPDLQIDDAIVSAAKADTENASRVITMDMEADASGVVPGQEGRLDWVLNKGHQYSIDDVSKAWSKTRELIREKYGDDVVLYRADAPESEHSPHTRTVRFGDKRMAEEFATNGRVARPYVVPVDDIVAVFTSPEGTYREFIVKKAVLDRGRIGDTGPAAHATDVAETAGVTPQDLAAATRAALEPGNEEGRKFSQGTDEIVAKASDTPDMKQLDADIEDSTVALEKAKEVGAVEEGDLEKALEEIADLDRAAAEDAAVFDAAAACIARNS